MSGNEPLDQTVAARWRRELIGHGPTERRHWRTKVAHYEAVGSLLAANPGRPLRWDDVVAAVQPRGSRSTFYDVTGASATHPLIARYVSAREDGATQIAYRYRRASAVDQLIDEAKVWSYWPLRDKWLAAWRGRTTGADERELVESLEAAVHEWATAFPVLARAVDNAPPVCSVEDLTVVARSLLPWRAYDRLAEVVGGAVAAPPDAAGGMRSTVAVLMPPMLTSDLVYPPVRPAAISA